MLNDLRSLILACGSKNEVVNSQGYLAQQPLGTCSLLLALALGIISAPLLSAREGFFMSLG